MSHKFSAVDEEHLINLVRQHPALYNCKLKSYKNLIVKNNIWKKIGEELGRSDNDCRTRWKNIRDYYKRKRNEAMKGKITGSENPEKTTFFKSFSICRSWKIRPFWKERKANTASSVHEETQRDIQEENSPENIPEPSENINASENIEDESVNSEDVLLGEHSETINKSLTSTPKNKGQASSITKPATNENQAPQPPRKRIRLSNNEATLVQEFKKSREERTVLIKELLQTTEPQQHSPISMFFLSIAATVNTFTPELQAKVKVEVMNIVGQLELQNISQKNFQNASILNSPCTQVSTASHFSSYSRPYPRADSYSVVTLNSPVDTDVSNSYSPLSPNPFIPNFESDDM